MDKIQTHLDDVVQLGGSHTGVPLQKGGLLQGDAGLLVALKGLLQGLEGQSSSHQVEDHHHEHRHHRLPLHHGLQRRDGAVGAGVQAGHHAGGAWGDGEARQGAVAVGPRVVAHRVLHGGHAGMDQAGLHHAWLYLFGRHQVGLDRH